MKLSARLNTGHTLKSMKSITCQHNPVYKVSKQTAQDKADKYLRCSWKLLFACYPDYVCQSNKRNDYEYKIITFKHAEACTGIGHESEVQHWLCYRGLADILKMRFNCIFGELVKSANKQPDDND